MISESKNGFSEQFLEELRSKGVNVSLLKKSTIADFTGFSDDYLLRLIAEDLLQESNISGDYAYRCEAAKILQFLSDRRLREQRYKLENPPNWIYQLSRDFVFGVFIWIGVSFISLPFCQNSNTTYCQATRIATDIFLKQGD